MYADSVFPAPIVPLPPPNLNACLSPFPACMMQPINTSLSLARAHPPQFPPAG